MTATALGEVADRAALQGIQVSVEVHHRSITDNSWSTLHLLDLVGRPNVAANPDLGNIYWCYETPEETTEAAIVALAPRSNYWHCKSLVRVHIPQLQRAIFFQTSLPQGEIDYHFAISAMASAGYKGPIAIEGRRSGDQLYADAESVAYVKGVLKELA
jgi:sugar phosphate isomerase/epimerase